MKNKIIIVLWFLIIVTLFFCSSLPYNRKVKKVKVRITTMGEQIPIESLLEETTTTTLIAKVSGTTQMDYGFEEFSDQWFINAARDCTYIVSDNLPYTGAKSLKVGPTDCIADCHGFCTKISFFTSHRRKLKDFSAYLYETNAEGSGLAFGGYVKYYVDNKLVAECNAARNDAPVPSGWKICKGNVKGKEGKDFRIDICDITNRTVIYMDHISIQFLK